MPCTASKFCTMKIVPSTTLSSMYRRRCGKVIDRNSCQPPAPSTDAASMISGSRDCRPASRISIMNGVHCQMRSISTDILG